MLLMDWCVVTSNLCDNNKRKFFTPYRMTETKMKMTSLIMKTNQLYREKPTKEVQMTTKMLKLKAQRQSNIAKAAVFATLGNC